MIGATLFGELAGVLSFIAYLLYIFTTLRGKTKPNRATWWVLTLVGIMIASSYYAGGARETMWVAISYVVGPLIIAILSLKFGEGKWSFLDKVCLTGAIISAVIWHLSASTFITLIINIFMDFLGLLPTIKKSFFRPEGEDRTAWAIETFAGILNILAIERYTLAIAFYPFYILLINSMITLLLYKPLFKKFLHGKIAQQRVPEQ